MKIAKWLADNTAALQAANIPTARLDCLVLLEDATGKDRAHLLAHPELELSTAQLDQLASRVEARSAHQPLAYIRGKTEFYGREFVVTPDVLEPRPESETLVELALQKPGITSVVDIGCGSGALGISVKLERPSADLTLIDIDPACLRVARQNLQKHHLAAKTLQSNLLEQLSAGQITDAVLLANLPYVPDNLQLNEAANHEPRLAIFGGADGLDLYRELFGQLRDRQLQPAAIICESLPSQHTTLAALAAEHNFSLVTEEDFIQVFCHKEMG